MGKGLSKLQKQILTLAHEGRGNRDLYDDGSINWRQGADVTANQVFGVVYMKVDVYEVRLGSNHFSIARIGESKYRSAKVAISKAFRRLEERGLVVRMEGRNWGGVNLTDEGMAEAKKVTANTTQIIAQC